MSKKIVIVPTFAESHLIKCQIPNIIDTINPDYIVYQEGLFPNGTEGNKQYTTEWLDKYTTDGKRGFDWEELRKIVYDAQNEYPNTEIILNPIDYQQGMTSTDCYVKACLNLEDLGIKFEEGDYIFPYEGDVFHHEKDKKEIDGYINQIEPGQGFRSIWVDYMQNFWYSEKCRIKPWLGEKYDEEDNYMSRRICLRYDEGGVFYKNVLDNFMTTDYHNPLSGYGMLYPTDLITYHYAWIRPGKFRELRCDQLQRQNGYWERFVQGLDLADKLQYDEILIRPNVKQWTNGWIKYFDELEHPKHVKNHELWFEIEDDIKKKIVTSGRIND
tara:strand:+ start:2082 stop:3065 length:984 start_codon:yes stop_codon:yes gene_type:complete